MNLFTKMESYVLCLCFLSVSCGNKSSNGNSGNGSTYTFNAVNRTHLAHSFSATTPSGFKGTGLHLADACTTQFGSGTPQTIACRTMADIQSRFFSGLGPTDIEARLSSLDTSLNSAISNVSTSYVPCLDSSRITSSTYTISQVGDTNNTSYTFAPYSLTNVPLKSSFLSNYSLDTGDSLKLSCTDASGDDAKAGIGNAYGFDSSTGTWYLYSLSSNHIGTFGSTDQNDNVEMWFSIGDTSYATDQGQAAAENISGDKIYGGSTGIVQIISKPSLGLVGLSQVGTGIGPGCGSQLLMNSSTLYFVGNVNNYGSCFSTDYNVTNGTSTHNASLDSVSVCMDVSGSTVTPTPDLSACLASGLISKDDNGNIVSPFSHAGLRYLTANPSSGIIGAIAVRAWMGSFFMANTDLSSLALFGSVAINSSDTLKVNGYSASSFAMDRTTSAANQNTSVSATCSSSGSAIMNESFVLSVSDIFSANSSFNSKLTEEDLVTTMNAAFKNTGDAATQISVPVLGTRGTSFYGTFSGTATASLDGNTLATANLTLPGKGGLMSDTVKLVLPNTITVTDSSKFKIEITGTLNLTCDNSNTVSRTVAVKAGVPSLTWYEKP